LPTEVPGRTGERKRGDNEVTRTTGEVESVDGATAERNSLLNERADSRSGVQAAKKDIHSEALSPKVRKKGGLRVEGVV